MLAASLANQPLSGLDLSRYATVPAGTTACAAVAAMNEAGATCAMVIRGTELVGIFTERDVLMKVALQPGAGDEPVETLMTADPVTLTEKDSAADALEVMADRWVRNVPVLAADGALAGNVAYSPLMCLVAEVVDRGAPSVSEPTVESGLLFIDFTGLSPHKPVTVSAATTAEKGIQQMQMRGIGSLLVVDEREHLVGVMTEYDVQTKLVCTDRDPGTVTVGELMTTDPVALSPRAPIAEAVRRIAEHGFTHVPLVADSGRPVGVVSFRDIADYLEVALTALG